MKIKLSKIIVLFSLLHYLNYTKNKIFFEKDWIESNRIIINKAIAKLNNTITKYTDNLIYYLNKYEFYRKPKNIIISDLPFHEDCNDINGYYLFEYYQEKNISDVYYMININSSLFKSLEAENKTKNLIIYEGESIWDILFDYLLNSKIIIQSYTLPEFINIIDEVQYLKYLRINHGIKYFKRNVLATDLVNLKFKKRNMILSSPYELNLLLKINFSYASIYKAGLSRYDRFKYIKKNESEKDCILVSFTYRSYNYSMYKKSLLKKNIESFLNNKELISYLQNKNIDLLYIPHHYDLKRNRTFDQNKFIYAQIRSQSQLSHLIEQCSLIVTDFSSICFDFMFQNKPALFYFIDLKEKFEFEERKYMKMRNKTIYFGNDFEEEIPLIKKIKYYADRNFDIGEKLKKKYNSIFFYKDNIRERIVEIVNEILNNTNQNKIQIYYSEILKNKS